MKNPGEKHGNTLWMYWEGECIPDYYQLCQESILRRHDCARIVGPDDLPGLIGEIPEVLKRAYITYRVDWIRKMLLWKQGGMYIDSDFICLKPLDGLLGMAPHFDYVGYQEWGGGHMDNFMCARQGSPFMKSAADYALHALERKHGKIGWLEASRDAIRHAISEWRWRSNWMMIPTHLVTPVSVTDKKWFTSEPEPGEGCPKHFSYGYMTSVHSMNRWVKGRTRDEFLNGNARVCHLLRKALELEN